MIKFIYGNPGTGKTEEIYKMLEQDAANHKKALLIVPEQMTVSVEREIIERLPPYAQLYIEVLNYTRLANKLFREHGGVAYNFTTKGLQKLLMWRAIMIAAPLLSEFSRSGNDDIALAESFLATYNELTASGVSLEQLEKAAMTVTEPTIIGKIKDIVTVCSIYASLLSPSYSDGNSELKRLDDLLKTQNCLSDTNIYFDGFSSITGVEHSITKSIFSQADNCAVTIGIPSPNHRGLDTMSLRTFSDHLRRDCASLSKEVQTITLSKNFRTQSNILSNISANLWEISSNISFQSQDEDAAIELIRAADIYDECEYAAASVRRLIETGYKYSDIVIIARNSDKYRGIIEPALETMDIPYYLSEKTDLSLCPIAKLILSALRITIFGWQRTDVISHIKTGLCKIAPKDADIFEDYTARWNITGNKFTNPAPWNMNPDGYTTQRSERGELTLSSANAVKANLISELMKYSAALKASKNIRELCLTTVDYLNKLEVKDSLKELASKYLSKGNLRQAEECVKMYDVMLDALECVCDAFANEESIELPKFYIALKTALEESELGSIPTSMDEVTIGSANMLRAGRVKCAVLLGLCDGEFPSNAQSSGLLNDTDREYLIGHNIMLSGNSEMRASDELYYIKRAASSPSEKLIVFTRADSEPSIAFTRLRKLLGDPSIVDTASDPLFRFRTLKSIQEYIPLYADTDIGEALQSVAMSFAPESGTINLARESISAERDTISKQTVSDQIGVELRMNQSRIEDYVKCKFAYSCKYYLKLEENKKIKFSYNNIGTFVHKILEKFLYWVFVSNKGTIPPEDEKSQIVDSIIENYISELIPDIKSAGVRMIHLIERLKKMTLLLLNDILTELSDSDFYPKFFELKIGTREVPSIHVALSNGTTMFLNGVADRIDVFESNGKSYVRVVDYKTGNKTFSLSDIEEGKNLQLLIYLFSLTKNKDVKLFGNMIPVAAGITYISTNAPKAKSSRYNSEVESFKAATEEISRSGLILADNDIVNAVSRSQNNRYLMSSVRKKSTISKENLELVYGQLCDILKKIGNEILTGNANAIPKDGENTCKYCQYSLICRASQKKSN